MKYDHLGRILLWFQKAVPAPKQQNFSTQTGCHLEEVREWLMSLEGQTPEAEARLQALRDTLKSIGDDMKAGEFPFLISNAKEYADGLADQVVTAVGNGHMSNIDILGAVEEASETNWSKFDENGEPILHPETAKVMKGPLFRKPDFGPFVTEIRFATEDAKDK